MLLIAPSAVALTSAASFSHITNTQYVAGLAALGHMSYSEDEWTRKVAKNEFFAGLAVLSQRSPGRVPGARPNERPSVSQQLAAEQRRVRELEAQLARADELMDKMSKAAPEVGVDNDNTDNEVEALAS